MYQSERNIVTSIPSPAILSQALSFKVHCDSDVRAGMTILKDTVTCEFDSQDLLRIYESDAVKLGVSTQGLLVARNAIFPYQWVRTTKLAKGIHESNTILERVGSKLRVRVVKTIEKDGDVFLWFSEEIASFMRISFLRLENIQGQYHYRCHDCNKVYENPNPLKLHIATDCDHYSVDILYQRLNESLRRLEAPVQLTPRYSAAFLARPLYHQPSPPSNPSIAAASHLETIVSNMGTSKDGHICIYCGKLYSRKYGLKIHIRTHTGFKPLKCKFCFRPFGDPSNLNKHLRLHAQSGTAHRCNLCNKVMVRKRDLERHNQTRHGIVTPGLDVDTTTSEEDIDVSCDS